MPTPFPKEFRADVIAVARKGDQTRAQVAKNFGISDSCLARWLRVADREDALAASGPSTQAWQDALGRLTPIEFETLHRTAHAA